MKKYISDGTWFKKGTEAKLLFDDMEGCVVGLFEGIRIAQNECELKRHALGEEYLDEEMCGFDEFEIIEE